MRRSPSGPLAVLLAGAVSALLLGAPRATAALDEPGRLWLVGQRAFEDRLNGVARVSLERLVERYPTDSRYGDALLLLGKVRFAEGALEPALAAFRQARRRTLRARGFAATSSADACTALRVTKPPSARPRQRQTGSSGGQMQSRLHSRNLSFTRRSSSE